MAFSTINSIQSNWSKNNVNVIIPYLMLAGGINNDLSQLHNSLASSSDGGTTWVSVKSTSQTPVVISHFFSQ